MTRLASAIKTDVRIQVRNRLYIIGPVTALAVGFLMAQITTAADLVRVIPVTMILVVGGSTLLYVAGLIIFEKDEGTLNAVIVSPLRTGEYLLSKIVTLTLLATVESAIIIGPLLAIIRSREALPPFDLPLMLAGIVIIGVIYTLTGITLIARYDSVTDMIVPLACIGGILQLPFLYFLGLVTSPAFLLLPTSAPTLLIQAAFRPLAAWEWAYALGYSALVTVGLAWAAVYAFRTQIVLKAG